MTTSYMLALLISVTVFQHLSADQTEIETVELQTFFIQSEGFDTEHYIPNIKRVWKIVPYQSATKLKMSFAQFVMDGSEGHCLANAMYIKAGGPPMLICGDLTGKTKTFDFPLGGNIEIGYTTDNSAEKGKFDIEIHQLD